jgi:CubicO group peptidase (beta-lactamase class C family)
VSRRRFLGVAAAAAVACALRPVAAWGSARSRGARWAPEPQGNDPTFAALGEAVGAAMTRGHVPGAAVGLLAPGLQYADGFGVTNVDHPRDVDLDTLFLLASITKTYTATAIMRLVEQGRLDLDVPIRSYLLDLRLADPDVTAQVTLRHCLTHTTGLPADDFLDFGDGDDALARYVAHLADLPLLLPLGFWPSYSNAGFALAGRVLEVVSAQPYEQAITALVLAPLGMTRSFFAAREAVYYPTAVGHISVDGVPRTQRPWQFPRSANPFGGMISSLRDQLRYARFWLGDGTAPDGRRLLSPETLTSMITPQVYNYGYEGTSGYGLAWGVGVGNGLNVATHDGGAIGQMARLQIVRERGYALCALTNALEGTAVLSAATVWGLEHGLSVPLPQFAPATRVALPPAVLAGHVGRYVNRGEAQFNIQVRDDGLTISARWTDPFMLAVEPSFPPLPTQQLAFDAPNRAYVVEDPAIRGHFLANPDGTIAGLFWSGRFYRRTD